MGSFYQIFYLNCLNVSGVPAIISLTMAESQATAPAPDPTHGPIFGAKPEAYYSFTSTLRRHHRLITFVGALIIFVTFLVKEGLRDELRETQNGIERATHAFSADVVAINAWNEVVRAEEMISHPHSKKDSEQDQHFKQRFTTRSLLIETHIASMSWVLPTLPEKYTNQLTQLYGGLLADSAKFKQQVDSLSDEQVEVQYEQLSEEFDSLRTRLMNIEPLIGKTATMAMEDKKSQYEIATWLSYFLYTLGWGFALIGRLVGVNAGGDE